MTTLLPVKLEQCQQVQLPISSIPVTRVSAVQSISIKQEDCGVVSMTTAPTAIIPPVTMQHVPSHANAANVAAARAAAMAVPLPRPIPPPSQQAGLKQLHPAKAKKSKAQPVAIVTMATAATATSTGSAIQGENTGRWTADEHRLFLQGLEQHGKGWKKIASLIKSRTVVQIRTHAQKYFQKLAKARQNGEDEIPNDGRCGANGNGVGMGLMSGMNFGHINGSKRRRPSTGTKRKAISCVVASAQREGKRLAATSQPGVGLMSTMTLPSVAPALQPFILQVPVKSPSSDIQTASQAPNAPTSIPSITTAHGTISGAALEDSLFRFLTPAADEMPQSVVTSSHVNNIARQVGAGPIAIPIESNKHIPDIKGDVSPTGVADMNSFPSLFSNTKGDCPQWFTKGADVDELLNEADALDWLADSGDLSETYQTDPIIKNNVSPPMSIVDTNSTITKLSTVSLVPQTHDLTSTLCNISDHSTQGPVSRQPLHPENNLNPVLMPPLPSLFESNNSMNQNPSLSGSKIEKNNLSSSSLFGSAMVGDDTTGNFPILDTHFDEQAFVSALLENNSESQSSLSALQ